MIDARPEHWPVIVVGAGPTGLTLANLLAHYGVRVLVVEKNAATVGEPRAVSIDDEALRTVQTFGAVDTVLSQVVLGYGSDYYSASGRSFLQVKPTAREYGYPKRNAFRQPVFEAQLAGHLATRPEAELWFRAELVTFHQDASQVTASIQRDDGPVVDASCTYLVACDGARSFVRERLGIPLAGSTFRERWLIVDIEDTNDPSSDTKVFCNPERPCITLPGPSRTRRFEFMLREHETDEEVTAPAHVASLLRLYGDDDRSSIRRTAVYTFHARVAERWSAGRIFLAGDAAHLSPPFAGQGMNSGIRDAHNLAWKLAAVVRGRLGPGLLASYEEERRRHAWEMIQLAMRMGHVMMPRTRASALVMQSAFRLFALVPAVRDYFGQMKYRPKPVFHSGFLTRDAVPDAAGRLIGRLLPQPTVEAAGRLCRLDDVLGDEFCLLATPGTRPDVFASVPDDFGSPLHIMRVAVAAGGSAQNSPPRVATIQDPEGVLAAAKLPPGLLLLRPDRYVAAFLPADAMAEAVSRIRQLFAATWSGPAARVGAAPLTGDEVVNAQ